jgi:gamma-aminobutyric acid type B receptor
VNENQIDNLKYIGFVAVGISFILAIGFIVFTWIHRKKRVIKAAQPVFLYMIGIGVIVMTSAIIPLSIDDSYGEHTQQQCNIACMSYHRSFCIGFVITFSALFAKTWRVNKIFQAHHRFVRKEVSEKDVIVPFVSLLLANILVLSLWTALAPLEYTVNHTQVQMTGIELFLHMVYVLPPMQHPT